MRQIRMLNRLNLVMMRRNIFCLALPLLLLSGPASKAAPQSSSVSKWDRFEKSFESSASYDNPAQEATLQAVFISPSGTTNRTYGFWDGGSTWRLRFAPNQTGKWTYKTICSDEKNTGLNGQSGE